MPVAFRVTRGQIIARGLTNRCPNCGARTLFQKGTLFKMNEACPHCDFPIHRGTDEGFYLGSLSLNYGVTLVCYMVPLAVLAWKKVIPTTPAIALALVGAILVPALLYRPSRSWFLMNYYFFLPQHLPANGGTGRAGEDRNV